MPDLVQSSAALAPGFLVASPGLADPNFAGSLVLVAEHKDEGAMGFIVNRPGPVKVGEVLEAVDGGLKRDADAAGLTEAPVLVGGPVQPERLWVLYRPVTVGVGEDALRLADGIALGGSRELIEALVRSRGADPFHFLLGYAGWGPLQVEREVAAGGWIPLRFHHDLVFGVPYESRWEEAVRRLGLTPGDFTVGGGGAMA